MTTPGGYDNTTEQAYTYSMYTETILGGHDTGNVRGTDEKHN